MKTIKIAGLLCVVLILLVTNNLAQTVTTTAGGFVGDLHPATKASFILPYDVVRDASGNTYASDTYGYRIRKISTTGIITTYAGTGIAGFSGDGGPATSAMIYYPIGLVFDPAGELVFADDNNNRVRKIDAAGNISTIAGSGAQGYCGDGQPATSACLNHPSGLTYDSAGNLYISDTFNNVVRKVDTTGTITTFAGNQTTGGKFCGDGGPATSACLFSPHGVVTDTHGNAYISDSHNFRVRKVTSTGTISTFAGNGTTTYNGDNIPATTAGIGQPFGLSLKTGVLYIATTADSRVRNVVLTTGIINTSIGSTTGYDGDGHSPSATQLDDAYGVLALSSTNIIVVDRFNNRVRQLSGGLVKTIAGGFIGDGNVASSASSLLYPESVAFDSAGNYYIADYDGNRIRKVATTGKISTVAGTGVTGDTGDGGAATSAELSFPQAVTVDAANNLYIIDQSYTVIRKVDGTSQKISTFSTSPDFLFLTGLAVDAAGSVYVADASACVIWKLDSIGAPTVFAGEDGNCGYNGDGIPAASALLSEPWSLSFDSKGNMYIADSSNMRVRVVNSAGIISTFAGNGTPCISSTSPCGDGGKATAAQFDFPVSVAASGGIVYIADEFDLRIRKVASGIISTYAGTGLPGYNGDGLPALSTNLDDPVAVAVNPVNKVLYLVDDVQARVRRVH